MSRKLLMLTAGELAHALERSIAAGFNPSTPEEWERFFAQLEAEGKAESMGEVPDGTTAGYIAGSLRDEGINCRVMRPQPEGKKDA